MYFGKSITKFGFTEVKEEDYFQDIKKVVCLLVKDGEEYRFAHRSFQAYFAACYTAEALNDEQQKKVLHEFVRSGNWRENRDYLVILDQLEHERMTVNLLEDTLRFYLAKAYEDKNPIRNYAKMVSPNAIIVSRDDWRPKRITGYISIADGNGIHFFSYDELFCEFVLRDEKMHEHTRSRGFFFDCEWAALEKIKLQEGQEVDVGLWEFTPFGVNADFLDQNSFKTLHELGITEAEVNEFYDSITSKMEIAQRITQISNWLDSIDNKRKKLKEKSFIDDL